MSATMPLRDPLEVVWGDLPLRTVEIGATPRRKSSENGALMIFSMTLAVTVTALVILVIRPEVLLDRLCAFLRSHRIR